MLTVHHSQHVPTALLFGKLALFTPFPYFLRSLYFKYTFGAFLVESTEETPLQIITYGEWTVFCIVSQPLNQK